MLQNASVGFSYLPCPLPEPRPTRRQSQRRDLSRVVLSHAPRQLPSWLIFDVRRKPSMKAFFLFVACSASVHAAASESDVAKLIAELPPQHVLSEARAMLVPADGMEDSDTKATASQLAAAKKVIEKAKEIIPKLWKLIKVGSAISDYPGLLGRGDIRYNERGQEIYLGGVFERDGGKWSVRFQGRL